MANKIEAAFIKNSKMESGDLSPFSPTNVMFANFEIFENKNDIGFLSFRKLQLSHKFNSDKQIFEWLIPTINKRFMEKYISDNYSFIEKYTTLYSTLNTHICDCLAIAKNSKGTNPLVNKDLNSCLQTYMNDSALINKYIVLFKFLSIEEKRNLILGALFYAQTNCTSYFKSSINLTLQELNKYITDLVNEAKFSLLNQAVDYKKSKSLDSLKIIFPSIQSSSAAFEELFAAYKTLNYNINYSCDFLVGDRNFERISSYLVTRLPGKKIKLIGQAVYEIGLDKPSFYIKNLKYYPAEKLQGRNNIELNLMKSLPDNFFHN
ncbi:MAG: hypothetical protein C0459_06260 [Chitinophaga sp.]|nr:hypothetical protein [Chitinophaga sp.]